MKSVKAKEHNPTYHETNKNREADNSYSESFEKEWASHITTKTVNYNIEDRGVEYDY